jgi:hypothetical protein
LFIRVGNERKEKALVDTLAGVDPEMDLIVANLVENMAVHSKKLA